MKTAKFFCSVIAMGLLLAACGGGGNNTTLTQPTGSGGGGGGTGATASAVVVTSDSAAILADGSTTAKITAVAYDTNHVALAKVAVTLSADTGVLAPYTAQTDSTGTLTTTLSTGGNPTLRIITVKATATGVTASTVAVQVISKGSSAPVAKLTISVDTPTILSDGSTVATVTARALDASNNLVPNVPVLFTADNPAIASTNPTTDASGAATAVVSTGGIPTLRTITVTACTGTCPGAVSATTKVQVVAGTGSVTVQMGSPAGAGFVPQAIAASSTTLSAGGSASLQVVLQQSDGTLYTQSVTITFSSICSAQNFANLTPSVTTTTGIATATYVASGCSPSDTVTAQATVGGRALSASVTLTVSAAAIGSIRFVSANPTIIALKGLGSTALPESSTVIFKVLDQSGNPRPGASVNFNLNTAVGGVGLLGAVNGVANATADANGNVSATVQSGTVATPVRVTAVVQNVMPAISTQSSALTISTGIPTQNGFSLSVSCHNVEAWLLDGVQVAVTARLSDRFNNPVPDGTAVSFYTEGGQIAGNCTSITTAGNSACTVNWTSQNPRAPRDPNLPKCVSLPVTAGTCDRDGRSSLLAIAIGEESFTDVNGNGAFDVGEPFIDQGERFLDANENGKYDNYGALIQGSEFFYDFNNNGLRDAADGKFNGVLCNDPARCDPNAKTTGIGSQNLIIMSGGTPDNLLPAPGTTFHIALGATKVLAFSFADINNNPLPAGTTMVASIAGTGLTLNSPLSFTYPCTTEPQSYAFSVTAAAGPPNTTSGLLTLTITSPGGGGSGGITTIAQYPIVVP